MTRVVGVGCFAAWLSACTSGTGSDEPATDTAPPSPDPMDTPWAQVSIGYEIGCGVHTDGRVECWTTWTNYESDGMLDEPDAPAVRLEVARNWEADVPSAGADPRPSACALDTDAGLRCWGPYSAVASSTVLEGVEAFAIGDYSLAVVSGGKVALHMSESEVFELGAVSGPGLSAGGESCAEMSSRVQCLTRHDMTAAYLDRGNVGELLGFRVWINSLYGIDGSTGNVRETGVGTDPPGTFTELLPPRSGGPAWAAVAPPDFVVDAEGWVFRIDDVAAGPVLSVPVVQFDARKESGCGVTADGYLACTGVFADEQAPPGSYVIPP